MQPSYRDGFPPAPKGGAKCNWCNDTKIWWKLEGYCHEYHNDGPCRICTSEGREILRKEMGWNKLSYIVRNICEDYNSRK